MLSERIETPKTLKKQRDTKHSRERDTYKTCNQKETRCTTKHETIDMRPFSFSIFVSLPVPLIWKIAFKTRWRWHTRVCPTRRDERIRFRSLSSSSSPSPLMSSSFARSDWRWHCRDQRFRRWRRSHSRP